jgi:hypothetical protein
LRKLPPLSSGAPLIARVGASGLHRGAAVYPVEVDGELFDLMKRFGGVKFEVQ